MGPGPFIVVDIPDESGVGGLRFEVPNREDPSEAFWSEGVVRVVLSQPVDFDVPDGDLEENITDLSLDEVIRLRNALSALIEMEI